MPASGAPTAVSSLKCRTIRSRAQPIRIGFTRWSGAIGPSGSHHVSPSASKRATSSDMMLGDGLTDIATLSRSLALGSLTR